MLISQEGPIPQMTAVQQALERCFADLIDHDETQKVKVEYRQRYRTIVVEYTNRSGERELHPMYEMSDGYRSVLSMVADIAHRMAVLNPQLGDAILETPGVIIIDEVELHLHPGWQKQILKDLTSVFPNIQFIVSTHSPEVITSYKEANLILLKHEGSDSQIESAYAGGIKREYGVIDLVSAFSQIDDPEWELVIYGDGTDMESVCEYAKRDVRIKIMGSAPNAVVMKHQREAALLINPRKNQEMAKYSFPSKTLEYMLSGTPMLGYKLAGIPEEYYDNMFVIQDSENGMEEALRKAMDLPETERIKMGEKAKHFVIKEKTPEKQCKKILELIGRLE